MRVERPWNRNLFARISTTPIVRKGKDAPPFSPSESTTNEFLDARQEIIQFPNFLVRFLPFCLTQKEVDSFPSRFIEVMDRGESDLESESREEMMEEGGVR